MLLPCLQLTDSAVSPRVNSGSGSRRCFLHFCPDSDCVVHNVVHNRIVGSFTSVDPHSDCVMYNCIVGSCTLCKGVLRQDCISLGCLGSSFEMCPDCVAQYTSNIYLGYIGSCIEWCPDCVVHCTCLQCVLVPLLKRVLTVTRDALIVRAVHLPP